MSYYPRSQKRLVYEGCAIENLLSGGFKGIIYGAPKYHMMSWAGENIHKLTIPGQPLRGYSTPEEALAFVVDKFKSEKNAELWCEQIKKAGTWSDGNSWYFIDFEKKSAELYTTPSGTNIKKTEIFISS